MASFYGKFSFIFTVLIIYTSILSVMSHPQRCSSLDSGPVTSTIPLISFLEQVQETALNSLGPNNFDPKLYIDFSLKSNLSITQQAFNRLPKNQNGSVSANELQKFIQEYFNGAGDDLIYAQPPDFVAEPHGFLPKVKNHEVRAWALQVHSLWKNLSRKVSPAVKEQPELHTLLPIPDSCVIPGSRFREVYYWDSYWVIRGLLASHMHKTATAIVTNLLYLVEKYGYVLNGARAYYTNRSQPPLLSSMIYEIYKRTSDINLVKKALPALLKEHKFWNSGIHKVTIRDSSGCTHNMSRYYAMWNKPRPESSTIDKQTASKITDAAAKKKLYREIASTAESGWDFSTRWMRNSSDLTTLSTTSIIPVDLNAYILKMELDIAFLAKAAGENSIAAEFFEASQAREKAFTSLFWNEKMSQWLDCWLTCKDDQTWEVSHQNQNIFASNFVPLWIKPFDSAHLGEKVMKSLASSGLIHPAGISTSLTNSGQQWDFPNGWAPMQHLIIEALAKSRSKEAYLMAEDLAVRWIRTNHASFKKTGDMHEKYDVQKCGAYGSGGEYIPQTGFGWTNGVALALLEEFGWPEDRKLDCQ
ncbi:probable trehalase [Amaranthus tricolor]|uniref:probable trehalase n=1 Tax=Amaranthus tricolor TaxID=29722 RepID=UPI002588998C|nr:probable trehalase [Amaranthus tricolor]